MVCASVVPTSTVWIVRRSDALGSPCVPPQTESASTDSANARAAGPEAIVRSRVAPELPNVRIAEFVSTEFASANRLTAALPAKPCAARVLQNVLTTETVPMASASVSLDSEVPPAKSRLVSLVTPKVSIVLETEIASTAHACAIPDSLQWIVPSRLVR